MNRTPYVCFAIVAAFQLHLAAASPVVEDALVVPSVAELADRLGLDPAHDRSRFMTDAARLLYATLDTRPPALSPAASTSRSAVAVPVPLPSSVWSRAVFRRTVPPDQLIAAILADRRAALLCHGLTGLDDETLQYLVDHPVLVTFLYEHAPGSFAAFGDNLIVRGGRVVPPGGAAAVPLWEAAVGESVTSPDRFVRVLFGENEGRFAYLYDVIAAAEPDAAAFALGSWIEDATHRKQRFRALALACVNAYREWHLEAHPFTRPLGDLAVILLRIRLDPSGVAAPPAHRPFWATVFQVDPNATGGADTPLVGGAQGPIDAAWLVTATGDADMYTRTDLVDQFAFGQRVFSDVTDAQGTLAADTLRSFLAYRMLMLTLERLGIRSPVAYESAIQRAAAIDTLSANHRFWALAQFQGAVAMLARMRRVGTVSAASASSLMSSLNAVPLTNDEYGGGIAAWMRSQLARELPREGTWEDRAIAGLSGPSEEATAPRIFWEGQRYRLDLGLAERQRIAIVRRKQAGHTLDLAFAIEDLAQTLRASGLTLDDVKEAARQARTLLSASASQLKRPAVNLSPPGVDVTRDGVEWITNAADDLAKITKPTELRRAARVGASLTQLADVALSDALLSFAYAVDIGDPEGAALLAGNVALRHDFGLARRDIGSHGRNPWALPRQDFQPGVPWHVAGSLLGLDIPLAPLNLRRLTIDRIAEAPKLSSTEREGFAVNIGLMDPGRLKDADIAAIAAAIDRGRARVEGARTGAAPLDAVADPLGFDGHRRRAVTWILKNDPNSFTNEFSLSDFVTLGGGANAADLDAWGTPGLYLNGCACTKFPSPRAWRVLAGRPQLPMMAATMGDLNLAVAVMLREMQLPAKLARPVLAVGMQEFLDNLGPTNGNDWRSLSLQAQALKRRSMEDYVAVAAAVNGPLVPEETGTSRDLP